MSGRRRPWAAGPDVRTMSGPSSLLVAEAYPAAHREGAFRPVPVPVPVLRVALADVAGIEAAGIFGSYAGRLGGEPGPPSQDVDLLVVGAPDPDEVYDACAAVARRVGRPVSPTVLSAAEWQAGSAFLTQIRRGSYVSVLGELPAVAALARVGESL